MDASNALAVTASALGIYQMNEEVKEANQNNTKKVTEKGMRFMLLSILINFLWMIYQFRKGSIFFTMYSMLGLLVQIYVFLIMFYKINKP